MPPLLCVHIEATYSMAMYLTYADVVLVLSGCWRLLDAADGWSLVTAGTHTTGRH